MQDYYVCNAKITDTKLGCLNDRGIFTFWIMLDYGSTGQGFGGICLDNYNKQTQQRYHSNLTGEIISGILVALELDSWEDLKGKYVRVQRTDEGLNGTVVGIGHIVKDKFFNIRDCINAFVKE